MWNLGPAKSLITASLCTLATGTMLFTAACGAPATPSAASSVAGAVVAPAATAPVVTPTTPPGGVTGSACPQVATPPPGVVISCPTVNGVTVPNLTATPAIGVLPGPPATVAAPEPSGQPGTSAGSPPGAAGGSAPTGGQPSAPPAGAANWSTYRNATYHLEVRYPSGVAQVPATDQPTPAPVLQVRFQEEGLVNSPIADREPPKFAIDVYANAEQMSITDWIARSGVVQAPDRFTAEPATIGGLTGVRLRSQTQAAPGDFYFVIREGFVYRFVPLGPIGDQMLATVTFTP